MKILDNMNIYVLGSNGMLGSYTLKYLSLKFNVTSINRDKIDASNSTEDSIGNTLKLLKIKSGDVIINCIGSIKPRVLELGDLNAIKVNSIFPRLLANACETLGIKLIHPTTDCVYSGLKGSYNEKDGRDATDVYGMTKALGEPNNCTIIRTSIIGEEINQKRSLIEWVKSNKNSEIYGYTNHFWNGITCLEFAKICKKIIIGNLYWNGVRHVHSDVYSKYALLELINKNYELGIKIVPKIPRNYCDRTISTIHEKFLNKLNIIPLKKQIKELKKFSKILYTKDE